MDLKWFPPLDRPVQAGGRSILAASLVGTTTLLLPKGKFRNIIAVPPIIWLLYNLRQHTTGKREEDYLTAVNISMTLARFADVCVLHDAEQELHRVNHDGTARETADDIANMTLWQKFRWNLDLFMTMRGIGWNWRVKNVDQVPADTSRSGFVLEQVLRASYCFAYLDIHDWFTRQYLFRVGDTSSLDLFSLPLAHQVLLGWKSAFNSGFTMVFGYYLVAAVAVGSGIYSPQSWPPMFGSFIKKGYTVRNIWGYCWHQLLRRIFETSNNSLIKLFGIRKGTLFSRYFQLYNAFFVSAIIHHIGALNCPYSALVWHQFYFFMVQPVAITIEDIAIHFGKRAGLKDTWWTRAVGYIWVGSFLSYSLRYAAAAFLEAGIGGARHPFVAKFSIMDRLFG